MKVVLGLLVVLNVALLLWGMGQRELVSDPHAPDMIFHPELIELLPPSGDRPKRPALITPATQPPPRPSPAPEAAGVAPPVTGGVAPTSACLTFGPFRSETERDRSGRQFEQMGIEYQPGEDREGRLLGYRVFLGPFTSGETLSRSRNEIVRKGISDLFLLREGAAQFISLGFFSNQASAQAFTDELRTKGVNAEQRPEYAAH